MRQINNDYNYSNGSYELQVGDVRDLTGEEIRKFNNKMDEIFKKENSTYSSLILKDNRYRFQVFAAKPIIAINTFPKVSTSARKRQDNVNSKETGPDVPFAVVDEAPIFPGCEGEEDSRACFNEMIQKHISKNFRYPEEAQEKGIQGRVSIMFTINAEGNIVNIHKRGSHKLLEDEAERIIKRLPKMTAGKHKGKTVNVPFSIPITFKLEGPSQNGRKETTSSEASSSSISVSGYIYDKGGKSYFSGTVSDKDALRLPGVTITMKGTQRSTISDFDGVFSIEAQKGDVLTFQYIGLSTTSVTIGD